MHGIFASVSLDAVGLFASRCRSASYDRGQRQVALGIVGLSLLLAACSGPARIQDIPLDGGRTVQSLTSDSDTSIVLLYSPRDCFRCFGVLSYWMRRPGVHLVLTEEPDANATRELANFRISHYDVTIRGLPRSTEVPSSHLFVAGQWIASALVRSGDDPVLRLVAGRQLRGLPQAREVRSKASLNENSA